MTDADPAAIVCDAPGARSNASMDVPRGDATVSAHGDDDFDVLRAGEGSPVAPAPELTLNTTFVHETQR